MFSQIKPFLVDLVFHTLIVNHVVMATEVTQNSLERDHQRNYTAEWKLWQMWLQIHPRHYPGYDDGTKFPTWISNLRTV